MPEARYLTLSIFALLYASETSHVTEFISIEPAIPTKRTVISLGECCRLRGLSEGTDSWLQGNVP